MIAKCAFDLIIAAAIPGLVKSLIRPVTRGGEPRSQSEEVPTFLELGRYCRGPGRMGLSLVDSPARCMMRRHAEETLVADRSPAAGSIGRNCQRCCRPAGEMHAFDLGADERVHVARIGRVRVLNDLPNKVSADFPLAVNCCQLSGVAR